jgi:hypothetical protein
MTKTPLTQAEAEQIGGALHRLQEIGSSVIVSPANEAEQKGTQKYLERIMVEHADEFLASWFGVHTEYEPLIVALAPVISRTIGIINRVRAQQLAQRQQAPVGEEPKNPLDGAPQPVDDNQQPKNVIPLKL